MLESNQRILEQLLPFLVEKKDLSAAADIISPHVISHMDHFTSRGFETWMLWVHFINTRRRVSQLDIILDSMEANPDESITAHGKWQAFRRGKPAISGRISATYKFDNGKIVEIWTTRTNYTFLVGPLMHFHLGSLLILLYFSIWAHFFRNQKRFHASPGSSKL